MSGHPSAVDLMMLSVTDIYMLNHRMRVNNEFERIRKEAVMTLIEPFGTRIKCNKHLLHTNHWKYHYFSQLAWQLVMVRVTF
jgi:transposase-like protein